MIALGELDLETETSPLRRLEGLLQTGALAAAAERRRLGDSVRVVDTATRQVDLTTSLKTLLPSVEVATLNPSQRSEVLGWLDELRQLGQLVQSAATREDLLRLPEKLRFATTRRENLYRTFRDSWATWINGRFEAPARLSALLIRFVGTRQVGERMQRAAKEGLALRAQFPPSEEVVHRTRQLVEELKQQLASLKMDGGTQHLLAFLPHVLDGTATLEHVTPELLQWLLQNHALGLLRVQL